MGGEKQQRITRHDDTGRRPFGDALRRVNPDVGIVGAHPIPVALPDVHRLCHDSGQNQIAQCGSIRNTGGRRKPCRVAAKMDSNALLRGGIQPDGLERAISGKQDVERVVGAHESGHESRRRTVKDFLGRADLHNPPGVDDACR